MKIPSAPPRPASDVPPAPEAPNPGAGALRPSGKVPPPDDTPDMDHPPNGQTQDTPAFDRGVAEGEDERKHGSLPGS